MYIQSLHQIAGKMESIYSTLFGCLLVIGLCVFGIQSDAEGDVRFVNELYNMTGHGRVEIFHENEWGTICRDYWDVLDANVACRQIGFRRADQATGSFRSGPGSADQPIWLNSVNCTETDTKLSNCVSSGWGNNECSHDEDAGAICTNSTEQESDLRLIGGKNQSTGRVEIYDGEKWGAICQTGSPWGYNESKVACTKLGYAYGSNHSLYFGPGAVPIVLSDVRCTGSELDLVECLHIRWDETNSCSDTDVVGVTCSNDTHQSIETKIMAVWLIFVIVISCIFGCVLISVFIGVIYQSQKRSSTKASTQVDPPPPYPSGVRYGSPPEQGSVP